jgi:hypothetical protein
MRGSFNKAAPLAQRAKSLARNNRSDAVFRVAGRQRRHLALKLQLLQIEVIGSGYYALTCPASSAAAKSPPGWRTPARVRRD